MKKTVLVLLLMTAAAFAQKPPDNGSREYRMASGTSVAVRFSESNPNLRTATYHIKAGQPVTVFFTRALDLKSTTKKDLLNRLRSDRCMFSSVQDQDLSCDDTHNDTMVILDTRERSDLKENVVWLDMKHYALPKKASN